MASQIRIAVVGFGLIGKRHASVINSTPGLKLCAIVDPSEDCRSSASSYDTPTYSDLAEMIGDVKPDGVVLATPTPMHIEQGLICIDSKCPLLIEKPIAVSASGARQLTEAAYRNSVPLLVGHHRRHNGMIKAAKAAVASGMIGDIRAIQATCWFYKPNHYFEAAPWRKKHGAGPISVNLVHDVDLLRHFCGEVSAVRAIAVPSRRGFENEDLATAILQFENGAAATISVSDSIVAPWSWELTARENPAYPATNESCYLIGGSEGGLSLPDLRVWKHSETLDWWTPISATSLTCGSVDPLVAQMSHFADVILGNDVPLVSGEEGMKSLEVVEAIAESAQLGIEVVLTKNLTKTAPQLHEFAS